MSLPLGNGAGEDVAGSFIVFSEADDPTPSSRLALIGLQNVSPVFFSISWFKKDHVTQFKQ